MAANSYNFGVNLKINADTQLAKQQLGSLQQQLSTISNMKVNFNGINALTSEINKASTAALTLQQNLTAALNPTTGNLNFSKFNSAIQSSGQTIDGLAQSLLGIGPEGNKAFMQLANSVARAEVPLLRTSSAVNGLWDNLKKTAGWQLSSSMIHGFIGGVQQAVGYAKALDESLTNIRIVTGQSAEQMAQFAKEANTAAKRLSATTTDYTNASLIYYQQGLSAAEVKKRADVTLKMANVSGQSAEKVADQMTAIWNNFDDGTKSMEHYADVMTALGAATASSSQEIAKGIQKFSAISETVGLSYEYAASALATITATTRESADTVGNSLKTLFSRIQGLQLGDTLDDGTTLNKYSTALAKVGISIKDASGALKDMDSILDEMGSKWRTLAEDQKMALAQTVGGVRQYTQIMTLMENWDFFKSNLGVAEGSAGTLQKQAEIFEDSWLGAQKRMKASWENLWDTLLDSEGFKKILNVGSIVVDGFAKAFQGLGGMGGIFSGGALGFLTSSLGTLFAPQISQATDTLLHNVGQLLPGARGRAETARRETIESMVNTIMDEGQTPHMTQGQRKVAAQNLQNLSMERSAYYAQQQYLTPDQKNAYSILDSQLATVRARQEETARLIDENEAANRRYSIGRRGYEGVYSDSVYTTDKNGNVVFNNAAAKMSPLWQSLFDENGDNSISQVASSFGQRSAKAIEDINTMTANLARGFQLPTEREAKRGVPQGATFGIEDFLTVVDPTKAQKGQARVSGAAFDILADLWKLTPDERDTIQKYGFEHVRNNSKGEYSKEFVAKAAQVHSGIKELDTVSQKTKNMDSTTRAQAIGSAMTQIVQTSQDKLATGLSSKVQGATKEDVAGMVSSSQKMTAAEYLQKRDAENEERIRKQQENLLRQTQTAGSILTNSALGISSTATAVSSLQGAIDNFKSGNLLGAATGLGSTAMNFMWGNQSFTKGIFGLSSKIAGSSLFNEAAVQRRNEQIANLQNYRASGMSGTRLQEFGLSQMNKFSSSMNLLAKNAGKAATAVQLSIMAYSFIDKKIDEIVNKDKNNAERAVQDAQQLQAAYQMSKNNTASLQASVEAYNKATEKLYDTNLQGAARTQAIYEQNSIASDLISKYGDIIADNGGYTRIGDTLKINEKALKAAEEQSIADTQIARYAADRAKIDANLAQDKYDEVTLEKKFGADGSQEYKLANGLGTAAGIGVGTTALIAGSAASTAIGTAAAAGAGISAAAGAGVAAVGGVLSMIPVAGWAALAALAVGAIVVGAVGAAQEKKQDNSLIDAILEKADSEGNLSWLDSLQVGDVVGDYEITEEDLKNIQENRKEINNLYSNKQSRDSQIRLHEENVAIDLLKNHKDTNNFKDSDKLIAGLIAEQENWYLEDNLTDYSKRKYRNQRITDAKSVEDQLGLTGKNVVWTDDEKNKRLTYTYTDANGNQQTSELSYENLAKEKATQKGKEEADQYISQMMNIYDTLKDSEFAGKNEEERKNAAGGMLSLLSGGNFDTATLGEIDAAQQMLRNISGTNWDGTEWDFASLTEFQLGDKTEVHDAVAKALGVYKEGESSWNAIATYAAEHGTSPIELMQQLQSSLDYSTPALSLLEEYSGKRLDNGSFDDSGVYSDWFQGAGKDIINSMDQATMKEFYKELSYIAGSQGPEAGQAYLDGLAGILQGVEAEDMGNAIQAMLAIDWDDWDNLDASIIDTMAEFGVTIDNDSEALKTFTETIKLTAKSIPNLEESMTSLIQTAGSLKDIKIGDKLSDDTIEALKAQGYILDDETFSTFSGENVVIGDTEHILAGVRDKIAETYGTYTGIIDKVENAGVSDAGIDKLREMNQTEFFTAMNDRDEYGDVTDAYLMASSILTPDEMKFLNDQIKNIKTQEQIMNQYQTEDGKVVGIWDETTQSYRTLTPTEIAEHQEIYDTAAFSKETSQNHIDTTYESIKSAMDAAQDPVEAQKIAEQYVSTFNSFDEAMADQTTQQMIADGTIKESDALIYYASKYPELTEYVNAYNHAMEYGSEASQKETKAALEKNIAMQDQLALYNQLTGKKTDLAELQGVMDKLKETMAETDSPFEGDDAELATLAGEAMIAAEAYGQLQKNSGKWLANLKESGPAATEAAEKIGTLLQAMLGLSDLKNITRDNLISVVKNFDPELLQKAMNGDRLAGLQFGKALALQANGGFLQDKINAQKDGTDPNTKKLDKTIDAIHKFFVDGDIGGLSDLKGLKGKKQEEWAALNQDLFEASGGDWETYQAAAEAAGFTARKQDFTHQTVKDGKLIDSQLKYVDGKYYWVDQNGNATAAYNENDYKPNNPTLPIVKGRPVNGPGGGPKLTTFDRITADNPSPTTPTAPANTTGMPSVQDVMGEAGNANATVDAAGNVYKWTGGGGGGGGGGGPTKVAVKSAQELMTRYKTIDAKSSIAAMQKANALTQKDLLYGEAKIAQLQKINSLLIKQQRLTADRIEEERQYLAEDKKHLQEVLDRYNKDKKDADGNVKEGEELLEFQFNSEGLITNYKQTIGVMAEELTAMYRDGELTAEEGKKAEELQKKIQDLNTVIQDYEDSLNQLQTSIDTYEQTLYEMFANQAEELAYKVTYKLEMENDDLSYIKFYSTALKDSMGRISDYIELTGYQVNELYDQIDVYNQGVMDLMNNAADNPMYMWATKGIEGTLTAEDITNLRTYRDGLNSAYSSLTALRKEVEDKVLKVFDDWHDKVNKNIDAISRYTDMLSQFKDIINIVGKEALGLSDAFMKTFEQQSIDQSKDNIEAAKKQYESLSEVYAEAQMKLEAARASGNEDSIKHWEEVVDKTQSEMESAQDVMLTTLQHTLNMVAEQFANAVTTAMDNFNESIYSYNGLDGLIADYERINEQQDLMVADYEKIYNLSKLNRQLEKTIDDTKLIAGKQKLLEFQQKINDINKSNVELSKYELEYLQAEYDLRLAEIELENARNAKDTVKLSRDSEGNWSYIYTQNESAIDEAEQKYEDALFKMQQLSQDYTKEMSASMMEITQAMRDEIAELSIQDFATPEEYYQAIQEIENRYSEQLAHREAELNKSIANSADLYNQDWQNYSDATGYKLSSAQDWTDRFSETTLGTLTGSGSYMSDYSTLVTESTNQLTGDLVNAATTYFTNANSALETYGTSLQGFAGTVSSTTSQITASSKQATVDVTNMATDMVDAFSKVADEVRNWQIDFGDEISDLLDEIGDKIKEINDIIKQANEMGKQNYGSTDLIGEKEAVKLLGQETFHNADLFGTWNYDEKTGVTRGTYTDASGEVKEDVERNLVEFTGQLVEMIDELTAKYYEAETDSPEREAYGDQLKKLFQDYWKFKNIINRIYDLTDISMPEPKLDEDKVEGLASGGYTGEWGSEGKLAFLHEKELVLNAEDTANFLQALQISRQLVEMIEMNARQSSLGLGEMHASTIQDTAQTIEQQVSITAEFPNAVDHSEIEEAFDNLINMASQYAYRS